MGTSGVYGGSKKQTWERARSHFDRLLSDSTDASIPSFVQAIAQALTEEDPESLHPDSSQQETLPYNQSIPLIFNEPGLDISSPNVSPTSLGGGNIGGKFGDILSSKSPTSGRKGIGSRRNVVRAARLGGSVLAAGYALQGKDQAELAKIGLRLDELQAMRPRQQRLVLLNAIIGDTTHPDDVALRKAADEFLKKILTDTPPTPLDAIRDFVVFLIVGLSMVEVKSQLDSGAVDIAEAIKKEKSVKEWIIARLSKEDFGLSNITIGIAEFQQITARLMATALEILKV